jgi:hypothetical protein
MPAKRVLVFMTEKGLICLMQGVDAVAVLLYLGPSSDPYKTLGFLDRQRLNVATSRAQSLMVVVGDFQAIKAASVKQEVACVGKLLERWGNEQVLWNARNWEDAPGFDFQESEYVFKYPPITWRQKEAGLWDEL